MLYINKATKQIVEVTKRNEETRRVTFYYLADDLITRRYRPSISGFTLFDRQFEPLFVAA